MKEPIKVLMLPTEDKSTVYKLDNETLHIGDFAKCEEGDKRRVNQHLHITVSQDVEPIKAGDWCIAMDTNIIFQVSNKDLKGINNFKDLYRKIISTTDPKLTIPFMINGHSGLRQREVNGVLQVKSIPQVQQSFLKELVANPDGEWEVEYNTNNIHNQEVMFHEEHKEKFIEDRINGVWKSYIPLQTTLKLNQNNEVNITSVNKCLYDTPKSCENSECRVLNKCNGDRVTSVEEKMYTLEQMYLSAANVTHQIAANRGNSEWNMKVTPKMVVDNWLTKENLKP